MGRYMLVTVWDREIMVKIFVSYEDTIKQRNKEMLEACRGDEDREELKDALINKYEYVSENFGFNNDTAWVNGHENWDWKIYSL